MFSCTYGGFPQQRLGLNIVAVYENAVNCTASYSATRSCGRQFLLLERGGKTEASEFLEHNLDVDVRFTTWDDYSIMAMVSIGEGIALLLKLNLEFMPYEFEVRPPAPSFERTIGLAVKNKETVSYAMQHFMNYIVFDSFFLAIELHENA